MLMMRSTPVTKMGKPPPPVPPRPSKTLVAEALAKTRRLSPEALKNSPVRMAPPPPPPNNPTTYNNNINNNNNNEVIKSQSCVSVNTPLKKPTPLERSISEEVKCSTRTVIFQSPKIEPVDNKKQRVLIKKADSFKSVELSDKSSKEEEKETKNEDSAGDKTWDQMLNDRNHVNTLIDEMFASVLEVPTDDTQETSVKKSSSSSTVVVVTDSSASASNSSTSEKRKQVQFLDDRMNHELLISELESMRIEDEKISKRQRLPSQDIYDDDSNNSGSDASKIQRSDWVEVSDGQEVRLSSCQITIDDKNHEKDCIDSDGSLEDINNKKNTFDYESIQKFEAMSYLYGLPPLPKSLSGFNLLEGQAKPPTPVRTTSMRGQTPPSNASPFVYPPHPRVNGSVDVSTPGSGRKSTNLDAQLAILRREMYSLRQLDLSLLSQLWSLNESIQDFRQILQDQEDRVLSPPSPSPAPSSGDEGDGDEFSAAPAMNFRTPPPPPPARRPSSSSNASSLG